METNKENDELNNDLDLKELFLIFWNKKLLIFGLSTFFATMSVLYALSLPNLYTSSTILAPTSQEQSLISQVGEFSALASITGINLPDTSDTKTKEAIKRIKSFDFFTNHFLPYIKLENLMAIDKWIPNTNTLLYDLDLYDPKLKKWTREVDYPKSIEPSAQEAYESYQDLLNIEIDLETGFVTLSIEFLSPVLAKRWLEIIVNNINESMRELDRINAQNSISFLKESTKLTNLQSIRDVISSLLEAQMQTLMLTSSNKAYIFKTIDSPIIAEKKSGPSRARICIFFSVLGGFFSLFIVIIQYFYKQAYKT